MSDRIIERVWVYVGSNGVLSGVTPDQAQAQEIADQRPGLRAVEYVPAEQLQGAVEALRELLAVTVNEDGESLDVSFHQERFDRAVVAALLILKVKVGHDTEQG